MKAGRGPDLERKKDDHRARLRPLRLWFWRLASCLANLYMDVRIRWEVRCDSPVPEGPVVVGAKHASGFDIVVLAEWLYRLRGHPPRFQMGSFVGYRVLGRVGRVLEALGGFPVMRPKEVRRLSRMPGWDRASALRFMREINEQAEDIRRAVLREGGTLTFFPEGTRDAENLRPLVSDLELKSALAVTREGCPVTVWAVTISFGPPRWWRRHGALHFHEPYTLTGEETPEEVLARIAHRFASDWRPPGDR